MLGDWIRGQIADRYLAELRAMPVEQLRALWDAFGDNSFCGGYDCADVHRVLTEKGDGEYCAV